jgi:hypothetical protein
MVKGFADLLPDGVTSRIASSAAVSSDAGRFKRLFRRAPANA